MKIHQLEIYNFKSYCGRQIIGPFDEHFTCIVGPNGNGKSNILDAMLFVFGFKSSKLRQDSLSSLIHTSAFSQPQEAKVTVKFMQKSMITRAQSAQTPSIQPLTLQPQPNLISISRTIRRSNQSFYQLNNKRINWSQLREYLLQKNIDLEKNLFIILQGEVQRLCELSPDKLVQYLEYVSGSDAFIPRIQELQHQYVNNGIRIQDLKHKIKIDKLLFKTISKSMIDFFKIIITKIKLLQLELLITKKNDSIQSLNIKNHKQRQSIIDHWISLNDIKQKRLEKDYKQLQNSINEHENTTKTLYTKTNLIQSQITTIKSFHHQLTSQLSYKQKDLNKSQYQFHMIQCQKQNLLSILNNQEQINNNFHLTQSRIFKLFGGKNQYFYLAKQATKIIQQINNQQNHLKSISSKIHQYQNKLSQLQVEQQKSVRIYGSNGQKLQSFAESRIKIMVKVRQLNQNLIQSQSKLAKLTQHITQQKNRLLQSCCSTSSLTIHQKILNQIKYAHKLKLFVSSKPQLLTLRQLMLFSSSSTQQLSIINAITPQLDFIVLDNYQQAKQIVHFLNVKKVGRMSFVLREQIQKIITNQALTAIKNIDGLPSKTKRIYDLGKTLYKQDQKLWLWAVGNTLIAFDLQSAIKAAYHSNIPYRVITPSGEFIDISGSMTKIIISTNNSYLQDRQILQTRIKVLANSYQLQKRKIIQIQQQKQVLNQELNFRSAHKGDNQLRDVSLEDVRDKFRQVQQEKTQITREMSSFKQLKLNTQSLIKSHQQNLSKLQQKIYNNNKNMKITLKFSQLLQFMKQYQQILGTVKKIDISSTIISNHQAKLDKLKQVIHSINQQINNKKQQITNVQQKIKIQQKQIQKVNQQIRMKKNIISQVQQKMFLKQLQIQNNKSSVIQTQSGQNHLYSLPLLQAISNKNSIHNSANKLNMHNSGHKKLIQNSEHKKLIQNSEHKKKPKRNNRNRSQQIQQPQNQQTINDIKLERQKLKQTILKIQIQLKNNKKSYQKCLLSLNNIYNYLNSNQININQDKHQDAYQEQINNANKQYQKMQVQQGKQHKIDKQSQSKQQYLKLRNKLITQKCQFINILIDFIQQTVEKDKNNKTIHKNNQSSQLFKQQHQISISNSFIFQHFFNSLKVLNIGPEDQFYFNDFIDQSQKAIIYGKQLNKFITISQKKSRIQGHELFDLIDIEKLQFLYAYQKELLIDQQKSFSNTQDSRGMNKRQINKRLVAITNKNSASQQISYNTNNKHNMTAKQEYFSDSNSVIDQLQQLTMIEYVEKKLSCLLLQHQHTTLTTLQSNTSTCLLTCRTQRSTLYTKTFSQINTQINHIYNYLTKGNAQICMTNSINPFQGAQFTVRPEKKTWKHVNLLSGGEKTLTSLALIFACEEIRQFPFYFMDQIDAALDFRNVTNLAKYIRRKQHVQHIVISLRKNMYQQAQTLVCLYKINDVTKTFKVNITDIYANNFITNEGANQQQVIHKDQANKQKLVIAYKKQNEVEQLNTLTQISESNQQTQTVNIEMRNQKPSKFAKLSKISKDSKHSLASKNSKQSKDSKVSRDLSDSKDQILSKPSKHYKPSQSSNNVKSLNDQSQSDNNSAYKRKLRPRKLNIG